MEENAEEFYEELERAGQGGTSDSTRAGRSSSVNWFNTFQRYKSRDPKLDASETVKLDNLSEGLLVIFLDSSDLQRF